MSCKTMLDSSSSGHLTAEKHWMQQKQLKKIYNFHQCNQLIVQTTFYNVQLNNGKFLDKNLGCR